MVNTILAKRVNHIVAKGGNPAWPKGSKSRGFSSSTSVPGLCAKPIIDILLLIPDSADEAYYVRPLQDAGYVLRIREPEWFEHRMFKGKSPEVNLHVFSIGCKEADRMIDFRDWLIAHEDDRRLYANTKKHLATKDWKYVQEYADAKSEVVKEIFRHIFAR